MNPEEEETHHRPDDHLVEPFLAGLGHEGEEGTPDSLGARPAPTLWSRVWRALSSLGRSDR